MSPIEKELDNCRVAFEQICCDPNMRFEAEKEFALQHLYKSDYPQKIAKANLDSVRDAFLNAAGIGITLNPKLAYAYLVPRDGGIHYDLSYRGLIKLAVTIKAIRWAACELVYEKDSFKRNGIDAAPIHQFDPFGDRGDLIGVYCTAKTLDGEFLTTTMPIREVFAIRDRTSAWKTWLATKDTNKPKKCPWVTDEGEMIRKTCIKRAAKLWITDGGGDRLERAIHHLNEDGGEGIDFAAERGEPQPKPTAEELMPRETSAPAPAPEPEAPHADDEDQAEASRQAAEAAGQEVPPQDDSGLAGPGQKKWIENKGEAARKVMAELGIKSLEGLTNDQFKAIRSGLSRRAA